MQQMIGNRCMLCGTPTRKEGEPLCIRHDFEAMIALSYHRLAHRLTWGYRMASHNRQSVTRVRRGRGNDPIPLDEMER